MHRQNRQNLNQKQPDQQQRPGSSTNSNAVGQATRQNATRNTAGSSGTTGSSIRHQNRQLFLNQNQSSQTSRSQKNGINNGGSSATAQNSRKSSISINLSQLKHQYNANRPPISPSSLSPHGHQRVQIPPTKESRMSLSQISIPQQNQKNVGVQQNNGSQRVPTGNSNTQQNQQKQQQIQQQQVARKHQQQKYAVAMQRQAGPHTYINQADGPGQSMQPDKRISLHQTPVGGNSIDDLTIDIADLHREGNINAQKPLSVMLQPFQSDEQNQDGGDHLGNINQVHLQLDFQHNTIHQQQPPQYSQQKNVQQQQNQQQHWATSNRDDENSMRSIEVVQTNKGKQMPLSPKTHTKGEIESLQSVKQKDKNATRNSKQMMMSQQQPGNYSSSIGRTQLQIAMPNSTVTIIQQKEHITNQQQQQQANIIENNRSSSRQQPYSFPNQNEKRPGEKLQSSKQQKNNLSTYLSKTGKNTTKYPTAQSSNQKSLAAHQQNSQIRQQIGRPSSTRQIQQNDQESKSITRQQQQNLNNSSQSRSHFLQRNHTTQNLGNSGNNLSAMKEGGSNFSKKGGAAVRASSKTNQLSSSFSAAKEIQASEGRMKVLLEQRLQRQEQKFMTMLERVIESNEVIKMQMSHQIKNLQRQVCSLEDQVESLQSRDGIQSPSGVQDENLAWQIMDDQDINSGVRNSSQRNNLQNNPDMNDNDAHAYNVDQNQAAMIQQQQKQYMNEQSNKGVQKPKGAQDLILVNDDNQQQILSAEMMMLGAATCSPISQLDGIDFGKMLSTRGDKTFINEIINNEEEENVQNNLNNNVSPLPKLNLSVLSDPQQHKSMSLREQEFLDRINRLKKDGYSVKKSIVSYGPSENSDQQQPKSDPKFIGHIDRQISGVSRNYTGLHTNKQSETVPHLMKNHQNEENNILQQIGGEMTGRSENVQDTHRSSMVDKRHLEQKSLRPVSREPDSQREEDEAQIDDLSAACNEQQQHDAFKLKYQSIRNKRTNSLHQSRDNSFLSTYNASLIGMNSSLCFINPQYQHQQQQTQQNLNMSQIQQQNQQQMQSQRQASNNITNNVQEAFGSGQVMAQNSSKNHVISPMAGSGFQNIFGRNGQQAVSLSNQNSAALNNNLSNNNYQQLMESKSPNIIEDDAADQVNGDQRHFFQRMTHKINSRSASFHFSMKNTGDGDVISRESDPNVLNNLEWNSPSKVKTVRQTHTSVVQHSRRNDLNQSVGPTGDANRSFMMYQSSQAQYQSSILPQKCTCSRPNFTGPNGGAKAQQLLFPNKPKQAISTNQNQQQPPERISIQDRLHNVVSVERLSSLHQIHELPQSNSNVTSKAGQIETDQNQYNIPTVTDGLETIADEDAPLKAIHNGDTEPQLTEVGQATPMIPIGYRPGAIPQTNFNGVPLEGVVNIQPCGEYCQWLTAEAQREIIRGILTSTQGNTVLKASNGKPGEKRFLVNSVWWRKWCDYVNFDLVEVEQPSSQQEHLRQQRHQSRSASRHSSAKKATNQMFYPQQQMIFREAGEGAASSFYSTGGSGSEKIDPMPEATSGQQFTEQKNAPTTAKAGGANTTTTTKGNFMDELMSLKKSKSKSVTRRDDPQNNSSSSNNPQIQYKQKEEKAQEQAKKQQTSQQQPQESKQQLGLQELLEPEQIIQPLGTVSATSIDKEVDMEDDMNEQNVTQREENGDGLQVQLARIVPSIKGSGVTMRTSNNLNLYSRPGPVENHDLLQKRNCLLLKNNLIEHHNYVALPPQIWKHIYSWYSADWSIVRFLRRDSAQGVILDLYPLNGGSDSQQDDGTHLDTDGEGALAQ